MNMCYQYIFISKYCISINHSKMSLIIRHSIICTTKKENIFPFKFDTSSIVKYIPISQIRNIGKKRTIELMKCDKILYVDRLFPLQYVQCLLLRTIVLYLPAFFHFSFFKPYLCAGHFADLALILRCSLKPVFGFLPIYVMEFGTIYSCRVNFIYSAFSWPVT